VARFRIIKMRQSSPRLDGERNEGPVWVKSMMQQTPTETGSLAGRWLNHPARGGRDQRDDHGGRRAARGATPQPPTHMSPLLLGKTVNQAGAAPARRPGLRGSTRRAPGQPDRRRPRAEAARLIAADTQCRNTVVILVTGGGEGTNHARGGLPSARAATFLNVGGRRVPIYVIAIAPEAGDTDSTGGNCPELRRGLLRESRRT